MKIRTKGMFFSLLLPVFFLVFSSMNFTSDKDKKNKPTTKVEVETDAPSYMTIDQLPMNRTGRNVKKWPGMKQMYGAAHTGFLFNKEDNNTKKWRPQGITGLGRAINGKKYLIVSWYGIKKEGYNNRGARISIVNVTNMDKIKYRHVLLVDQNYNTFPGCHAGGLALVGNKLHVADSRGSSSKPLKDGSFDKILVFDITKIEKLKDPIKKYHYVLRVESSYNSPINPSYISYDRDDKNFLVGTFTCTECKFTKAPTELVWYKSGKLVRPLDKKKNGYLSLESLETKHKKKFRKVQGAATVKYNNEKYLVTTSSYKNAESTINIYVKKGKDWNWIKRKTVEIRGLEDVYFSKKNFWTLSEFRPGETHMDLTGRHNRAVVATRISKLIPKKK